ncbi:hypothetical protein K2173_018208 [Erythroxylum novogranatense]|uniref:Phosphatidic acid phosphatase type 2/haloperoxidase domain-containing protein n=1 Tax=Erythroxylum novogranatense TaxID=1862640 RepID=A0AAV8TL92_9ROSI|nr:hypothetical protein K2173_018208 [Erythroxylum novogranatense]
MAIAPPKPPFTLLQRIKAIDGELSRRLHTLFHPYLPTLFLLLLEFSADFRFFFPVSLALLLSPLSVTLLPFLSPFILGLLLDLAIVGLIKILFRRPRPPYNPSMCPAVSADNFSFPSGHASRVFFVASMVSVSSQVIGAALRGNGIGFVRQWLGGDVEKVVGVLVVVVCVWAAVTAASRVLLGRHYVFDVVAGSCLGVAEGLFAFWFLRFEKNFSMIIYQRIV